jgi:hypothetical protein
MEAFEPDRNAHNLVLHLIALMLPSNSLTFPDYVALKLDLALDY